MNFEQLIQTIEQTHKHLQHKAVSAVNLSLTVRNWLFGFYIVEYEQYGEDKARYGEKLLNSLAMRLKTNKIKGLSERNLHYCRQFYIAYPVICQAFEEDMLPLKILQTASAKLDTTSKNHDTIAVTPSILINKLSFSHFVQLINEENSLKRTFYEMQTIKGNWSVKELQRQMGSLLYERTGFSKKKEKLIALTNEKATELASVDIIRDPYIFEFLGLKENDVVEEGKLENLLLDHLQEFLLELGKGFCFESRQKRITVDDEHYRIDLVFYHRILKCHVLIDLKTRKFRHKDAGQMNFYLNYFTDNEMHEDDKHPIGIVLCTDKQTSTVKYATGGLNNQLFVSQYLVALPTVEELEAFIDRNKKFLGV